MLHLFLQASRSLPGFEKGVTVPKIASGPAESLGSHPFSQPVVRTGNCKSLPNGKLDTCFGVKFLGAVDCGGWRRGGVV